MNSLTIYYDGREIGQIKEWHQDGKALTLAANTLSLLEGMVIELSGDTGGPTIETTSRTGALVGQISPSGVLIQLDELVAFGTEQGR